MKFGIKDYIKLRRIGLAHNYILMATAGDDNIVKMKIWDI